MSVLKSLQEYMAFEAFQVSNLLFCFHAHLNLQRVKKNSNWATFVSIYAYK